MNDQSDSKPGKAGDTSKKQASPSDALANASGDENEIFHLFADNLPTLCWMANADGYITWYNQRWHEYCGSTPEQMEGWGWQKVHDPEVLPKVMAEWTASIQSGQPFEMTFPLRGSDDVYRSFLTRAQPHRNESGQVIRWFGVNIDVSEQLAVQQKLEQANARLNALAAEREATLGQLGEGVILTDPTGRITFVNDAAARLHGISALDVQPEDFVGTYSLFTPNGERHPTDTLPLVRAIKNQEVVIDAHWMIHRPDGSEVLAMGNARPVYGANGVMIGAVLTIRDDTSRHAAEVALADAVAMKDVLLHEVNHRVKNSLQLVTSLLSLQADKASPEARQSLIEARTRIGVIGSVHQRLYTTAQHDRVDLAAYLSELASETVRALDSRERIKLNVVGDDWVVVPIDQAVSVAIVTNELLTNAMKYAFVDRTEGTISLSVRFEGENIMISLGDDGMGLPEGFLPATSKGLGMRIVTALVRQIRGSFEIPLMQPGANFLLTIPRKIVS